MKISAIFTVLMVLFGIFGVLVLFSDMFDTTERDMDNNDIVGSENESSEETEESDEQGQGTEQNESESNAFDETALYGTWNGMGEMDATITFTASGDVREVYASGAVIEEGTYSIYHDHTDLPRRARESATSAGVAFIREVFGDTEYFYEVGSLSEDELILVDLSSGDTLTFGR